MYAHLCHRLCEEAPNFESKDSKEPCTFRILLLGNCKQKFESRPQNEMDKRKSLGNIKFIGELCKLGVVSESILHKCMVLLLKKCDIEEQAENLECLCQILKTCGRILDHEKGQKLMNQYFERMESLMENEALPSRIRFMLQDSIELRSNAWVPRKAAKIEGPLPMNQIMVDGEGAPVRERPPQQELFPRQLKTRNSGIDAMLSNGTIHFPQSDKFPPLYTSSNGYGGTGRGPALKVPSLLYQQPQASLNLPSYHHNNRYNNNSNNNNSKNNNMKDMTPRFKRITQETTTNLEEVSLRPPANSMLVKQFNTKPASQSINNPLFKNSTGPVLTEHKPVPIQSSKEMPIVIKPSNTDKAKPSKKDKATTKEETMKKINSIAEDIMNEGNVEEAVSSFIQLKIQDRLIPECIVALITCTYEKTDNDRKNMMNLLMELKNEGSIISTQFSEAFRTVVKTIPDTEVSVPNIIDIIAEYSAQGINLELLSINQIGEMTENGSYFPLMFSTLRCLHDLIGKEKLSKLFSESKVSLMSCLLEGERRKEKLESVLGSTLLYLCPVLELEGQLWQALERESSAQSLYRQAKESLGSSESPTQPFVTALVTVVIKYIFQESVKESDKVVQDKEKSLLEKFKGVLQAFLHENVNLQVTAVYALQMFAYYLDFPKGMLLRWFVYLYDLEIVEEEAFLKWREDDVTDTYPGKGEALFQVNQWLNWLSTAEEEEDEEEGEN